MAHKLELDFYYSLTDSFGVELPGNGTNHRRENFRFFKWIT
jgi:hypothetical protein